MKKIISIFLLSFIVCLNMAAQNVGVGTTTPTQKLDVNGNLRVSGAIMPNGDPGTAGQVLTSNGTGNAAIWQTLTTTGSSRFFAGLAVNTSTQGRLGFSTTSGAISQVDSVDFIPPRYNIGGDFTFTTSGTTGNYLTIVNDGFYHLEWYILFNINQTTSNLSPTGDVTILFFEPGTGNISIVVNNVEILPQNDFTSPFGYAKVIHGSIDLSFKAGTNLTLKTGFSNLTSYPLTSIGITSALLTGYKISN